MSYLEILQAQLTDVFRIGLIVALVATMVRTRAVTGQVVPLLAGVVFVAIIIPMTMPATDDPIATFAVGIIANLILLSVALAGLTLWRRFRG